MRGEGRGEREEGGGEERGEGREGKGRDVEIETRLIKGHNVNRCALR